MLSTKSPAQVMRREPRTRCCSPSLVLSHATWIVTSLSPGSDKMSRHLSTAGDGEGLLALLARVRARAEECTGGLSGWSSFRKLGLDGWFLSRRCFRGPTQVRRNRQLANGRNNKSLSRRCGRRRIIRRSLQNGRGQCVRGPIDGESCGSILPRNRQAAQNQFFEGKIAVGKICLGEPRIVVGRRTLGDVHREQRVAILGRRVHRPQHDLLGGERFDLRRAHSRETIRNCGLHRGLPRGRGLVWRALLTAASPLA